MNASLLGNRKRGDIIFCQSVVLTLLLLQPRFGDAEDFKLSDGTIFRRVQVLEVRPDALVLAHDGGIAMADFAKLPKAIRRRYGYNPEKAAAYRIREIAKQRAEAEENLRLITAREERKQRLVGARLEAAEAPTVSESAETHLSLRAGNDDLAYAAAITRLGAAIAEVEESRIVAERRSTTFWGAPFWKHPIVIFLGSLLGGSGGKGDGTHTEPRNWR